LSEAMLARLAQPALNPSERASLHEKIRTGFSLASPAQKTLALYRSLAGM
jgi:hypothetical protein